MAAIAPGGALCILERYDISTVVTKTSLDTKGLLSIPTNYLGSAEPPGSTLRKTVSLKTSMDRGLLYQVSKFFSGIYSASLTIAFTELPLLSLAPMAIALALLER